MVSAVSGGIGSALASYYAGYQTLQSQTLAGLTQQQIQQSDLSAYYTDTVADLTSVFSTAASNEVDGLVNLAADAAAKRLGVALPSSAPATNPTATAGKTATSAPKQTSSFTNIDQMLARLDGNPFIPPPSTSSGTTTPFRLESFLGNLDNITSGQSASAPTVPTGKSFSVESYLRSLDSITRRPLTTVNVTA